MPTAIVSIATLHSTLSIENRLLLGCLRVILSQPQMAIRKHNRRFGRLSSTKNNNNIFVYLTKHITHDAKMIDKEVHTSFDRWVWAQLKETIKLVCWMFLTSLVWYSANIINFTRYNTFIWFDFCSPSRAERGNNKEVWCIPYYKPSS